MLIPIILIIISVYWLLKDYRYTIFRFACFFPVLNMFAGIGPLIFSQVFGLIAIVIIYIQDSSYFKRFPLKHTIALYSLLILIANFLNEQHTPSMLAFLSTSVLLPFVLWKSVDTELKIRYFIKCWTVYFLIICIYGFYEAATDSNPFAEWMMTTGDSVFGGFRRVSDSHRFGFRRIQSLMLYRDPCGAYSALFWGFLFYYRKYHPEIIGKGWLRTATSLLMYMLPFIVLLTGTRACIAIIVVCMIGAFRRLKIKYLFVIIPLVIISTIFLGDYLDTIYKSFSDTSSVAGSNLNMREMQLNAILNTVSESPIYGNGFGSWKDYSNYAEDILGAESQWFQLLLKVGILGTLSYFALVVSLVWYILKSNISYLLFIVLAFFVGLTLSSLPGFKEPVLFLFLGVIYSQNKKIKLKKQNY